jgi:S1-C subfamily serine protease
VSLNQVDLLLVVLIVLSAVTGYRQGFLAGIAGFVGFLGGAALARTFAPGILSSYSIGLYKPILTILFVLIIAGLAQGLFSSLGARARASMGSGSLRVADSMGGSVLSGISVLLVAWFLAVAVVAGPPTALTGKIRESVVLTNLDDVMPAQGRTLFSALRNTFDENFFPQVFAGIATPELVPVAPPDGTLGRSTVAQGARDSVVEVFGDASRCKVTLTGSGFAIGKDTVMTNAHVVAGTDRVTVRLGGTERERSATVVLFDPLTDVAVLKVDNLDADVLEFASKPASRGDDAIVIGFPGGGDFTAGAARIRDIQDARGADIYDKTSVVREIYSLRAKVRPGNSGGPLLDERGRVLGMIFAASIDDPASGYALTASAIAKDAVNGSRATAPVSTGRCL